MQFGQLKRRGFITLLGGAAVTWPLTARAQQPISKMPRVGIIDPGAVWDPFRQGLRDLGYIEGRDITIEYQSAEERPEQLVAAATESRNSSYKLCPHHVRKFTERPEGRPARRKPYVVLGSSGSIAPPQAILANSKNAPIKIAGNQNNIGIVRQFSLPGSLPMVLGSL